MSVLWVKLKAKWSWYLRDINEKGLALIKNFEGLRKEVYNDGVGVWTIGYGHTRGVTSKTAPITEEKAEEYLLEDLKQARTIVETGVKVPLTDNQFSALVALVFNVGVTPLALSLGNYLKSRQYARAATEFDKWVFAKKIKMEGLVRRRAAEKALFLES